MSCEWEHFNRTKRPLLTVSLHALSLYVFHWSSSQQLAVERWQEKGSIPPLNSARVKDGIAGGMKLSFVLCNVRKAAIKWPSEENNVRQSRCDAAEATEFMTWCDKQKGLAGEYNAFLWVPSRGRTPIWVRCLNHLKSWYYSALWKSIENKRRTQNN